MGFAPIEAARSARKWRVALASAVALVASPAAPAATADFSSSFEAGDPQPTWIGDVGLRNRAWRSLDLNELRGASRILYLRVADSHPPDGWGGWLARVRLQMERR
jgi:hypothetical protein